MGKNNKKHKKNKEIKTKNKKIKISYGSKGRDNMFLV